MSTPNKTPAGTKRKAESASPASNHGRKEQKTIEQTLDNSEDVEGQKDVEMKENGESGGKEDVNDENGTTNDGEAELEQPAEKEEDVTDAVKDSKPKPEAAQAPAEKSAANGNSAVIEDKSRAEALPSTILEKGLIYFFFRGRVGLEEPQGVQDIARSYIVLRPLPLGAKLGDGPLEDGGKNRLLALPKKVLPKSGRDRFMTFVEKTNTTIQDLKENFIAASDYATKTTGTRHTPSATPAGEGIYAITEVGNQTHLAYILTRPTKIDEVQEELGLRQRGSFVTSAKNPEVGGPSYANLPNPAKYSQEILDEFRSRGWMPLQPKLLDYDNCQFLLIGEGGGEIGKAVEASAKDEKHGQETPLEEMEKLEHEDDLRVNHLKGDDPVFEDLDLSSKEHHKMQTTCVNIALQASFDSPPYLLELLETAAEENGTAYFPLLDRIADGYWSAADTEQDLYNSFLQVLQDDGHITDPETLSSLKFALSIRSAAPRIEAHYQYYKTSVESSLSSPQEGKCPAWVHFNGRQYCSPTLEEPQGSLSKISATQERQFDRLLGSLTDSPPSILYADPSHPSFAHFHKILSRTARQGKSSYRLRYIPSTSPVTQPLDISGFGAQLVLKRTDYIVIDDRDTEKTVGDDVRKPADTDLGYDDDGSIKPLSMSELSQLGLKASSYVMKDSNPFDTLLKVSQDFPKHSAALASHNISSRFLHEFQQNRRTFLPQGYNVVWINGLQVDSRHFDAFALSQHLRRERKLIHGLSEAGLSSSEAIKLLTHPSLASSKASEEPQRYDFGDQAEGGRVIIWLNDIEKDKRYARWPRSLNALLQRTYPGQLPSVRRDIHNLVMPVDYTDPDDVEIVTEQLQALVKRGVPLRVGLVPLSHSPAAAEQAKVVYHLLDTYGLAAVLAYLEKGFTDKKLNKPNGVDFNAVITDRKVRPDKAAMSLQEVLEADRYTEQLQKAREYAVRLGADSKIPPLFINGVALSRDEDWLQGMSNRVSMDLQIIQKAVFEEKIEEDAWIPSYLLSDAARRRNALVIPADESSIKIFDVGKIMEECPEMWSMLPEWPLDWDSAKEEWVQVVLIADTETSTGLDLLNEAIHVRKEDPGLHIVLLPNPKNHATSDTSADKADSEEHEQLGQMMDDAIRRLTPEERLYARLTAESLGFSAGQSGLIVNGRVVGPLPEASRLRRDDISMLLGYERMKRSRPVMSALTMMGSADKIEDVTMVAGLSSLLALSSVSDTPEGIFDSPPAVRTNNFEYWNNTFSGFSTGKADTAIFHIVAALDPSSETAQRWIPILKVLSDLDGVHLQVSLNPREMLSELPIKRFYRHVLEAKPAFDENGMVKRPLARFTGIPRDALLNVAMDVPPSWLVAPKDSIHDLDNIKLSSLRDQSNIDAVYELENILIEGHSRDLTTSQPPRGVQLLLGTDRDPHFADTIIMANLGYFQFKANPGFWKLDLEAGRSRQIFAIESAGSKGYAPKAGDASTEIEMISFQGTTLFPRLSRKAGMETEDVLEPSASTAGAAMEYVSKGLKAAEGVLSQLGLSKHHQNQGEDQAEINIFSVASGHLYERMLNIMMVSVMKHTKHTVKFWFIEQFLSPSFKDFIPHLAAHYGFTYQLVTYKWPHWLRGQTEKQREIWGYKILFLDVLFPLSLDKVIFVDADQIVRTDMKDLNEVELREGAPYGFTPMCDDRTEMEGFRFWKQGYWANYLRGKPYHISALYVVDLTRFRALAAGDRLRQHYQQLSADPGSLSNLDQDLPNHMQHTLPIHSLGQDWLWCETWCGDDALGRARTIDLCNNPMTKEPKLDRARRQVPEWTVYDEEIEEVRRGRRGKGDGKEESKGEEVVRTRTRDEL
ncbi:MAG: hypothetical protein M1817_006698 [Caeruleum heppii]|nr:MAG: hypothetical protein M1817_006698 [Caeruleum heppii]